MEQVTTSRELVFDITSDTFTSHVLDDESPILLDFWAPWCGPCLLMKPILAKTAKVLDGEVRVAQINVDKEGRIAERFGIRGIPTLVLMSAGRFVGALSGVRPPDAIAKWVRAELSSPGSPKER